VKLCYRHVKLDLERQAIPIHVHVDAEITKGKYHDHDAFLNQEAAEYLRGYLKIRRQGPRRIPPENIHDDSRLIRDGQCKHPKSISEGSIHRTVHRL